MQMQEEIAKADASTAWCLGQCSVCAMTAAYLDPEPANEIFNVAPGILAWGAINHQVQAVPGGYMANARWEFASGSRQASWLGSHVKVVEPDGSLRLKKDGSPEIRTILFPVTSATMYDVWDVIGLRGTGTDSYSVENLFIPDKFAALRDDPTALREQGPLYKLTTNMVFSMGFGATSLGAGPRHAGCRHRPRPRQDPARPQGDEGQQRRAGPDRPHRGDPARRARLSLRYRQRSLARSVARRPAHRTASHRAAHRRDLDHPSIGGRGRHRLSHGRRHRRVHRATSSSGGFATCTPSPSRSRPATPITRMPARRSLPPVSRHRRRRGRSSVQATVSTCRTVLLRTGDLPLLLNNL